MVPASARLISATPTRMRKRTIQCAEVCGHEISLRMSMATLAPMPCTALMVVNDALLRGCEADHREKGVGIVPMQILIGVLRLSNHLGGYGR